MLSENEDDTHIYESIKGYQGNTNLKKVGEKINWTPKLLKEYKRCSEDIIYFAENYYKIVHIDFGLVQIPLCDYQKDLLRQYVDERYSVVLQSRQSFKTTSTVIFILWFMLFQEHKTVAILANKGATAREILSRIQLAYEHLPKWLQLGVHSWNKGSFDLENGSKIIASATSSSAIRGMSLALCYIDECISGDSMVTVKNKITGEIKKISIEELYNES